MRKQIFVVLIMLTLFSGSFVLGDNTSYAEIAVETNTVLAVDYQVSEPYYIGGDFELELLADYGDGTIGNPYVIENKSIDLRTHNTTQWTAISIKHTTGHLVIRNCYLMGTTYDLEGRIELKGSGIVLLDVDNVRVEDCIFNSTTYAVHASELVNGTFIGNVVWGDPIRDIDFSAQGLHIDDSHNINLIDNFVTHSSSGMISYNTTFDSILHNNVSYNSDGAFLRADTSAVMIANNTCSYNTYGGVKLERTHSTFIINNTCSYNGEYGVYLDDESSYNTIEDNTFEGNGIDIYTGEAAAAALAQTSGGYGIWMEDGSSGNIVTNNVFIDNLKNGQDDVVGNTYDYNYWSDYIGYDADEDGIGDTPYTVGGTAGAVDEHPRGPFMTGPTGLDWNLIVLVGGIGIVAVVVIGVYLKKR